MARVILERDQKKTLDVNAYILGKMNIKNITLQDMASEIGCSRQTLKNRLHDGNLTFLDLLVIFSVLELEDHEIINLMKLYDDVKLKR